MFHHMYIKTTEGIKLFEIDPTLYPDHSKISKAVTKISF
jgi:hypothetical protein